VLTHLAGRPAAVERVEAYLHQNARLRSLREHLPGADSADFAAPLQAALVASLRRRRARDHWRHRAVAAAVALVMVGGTFAVTLAPGRDPSPATGGATQTASAVPEAYFLFDKPELAALAPTVAASDTAPDHAAFEWLAGKLSEFSLQAPDFAQIGLELVGGETMERHGMPAIRLIYRDEAANPVVFHVGIGKPDADHAFWLVREGFVSLQWRRGPMVFVIVAPADSPQLSQVVGIVGAAVARLPADEPGAEPETPADSDSAAAESGPVQAIAAPMEPTAVAPGPSADTETHAPADPPLEAADENEPEPL
jgi:anti-sigma factor RsiW